MNDTIESKLIQFSRFPLACLVVLIHTNIDIDGWQYCAQMWAHPTWADIFRIVNLAMTKIIPAFVVPMFFAFSGYLFFKNLEVWDTACWLQKIKRRIKTLVIPYFVWVSFYVVVTILQLYLNNGSISQWYEIHGGLLNLYWSDVLLVPMWYVRDLIIVTICTPILFFLLKHRENSNKYISCIPLLVFFLFTEMSYYGYSIYKSETFLYFSLGAWLSINRIDFIKKCKKLVVPAFVFFIVLFALEIIYGGTTTLTGKMITPLYVLSSFVVFVVFSAKVIESEKEIICGIVVQFGKLAGHSFFLYAFHVFILKDALLLCNELFMGVSTTSIPIDIVNEHFFICLISMIIATIVTIVIAVLLGMIFKRYIPRFSSKFLGVRQ